MTAEKDGPRCDGVGAPVSNVRRACIGRRLPMVGDCPACGLLVEVTAKWTAKSHKTRVTSPAEGRA